MATYVTQYKGIDVYVDEQGKFFASLGSKQFDATSFAALKNKMNTEITAVPFTAMEFSWNNYRPLQVTGIGRKDGDYQVFEIEGRMDAWRSRHTQLYELDESLLKEAHKIEQEAGKRKEAINKQAMAAFGAIQKEAKPLYEKDIFKRLGVPVAEGE